MVYDDVFNKIGSFGRYQKFIYVLQTLPVVFTAIQTYLSVFILYVPDHRCASPNINATKPRNEGFNVNIDVQTLNSTLMYSRCEIYENKFTTESLHQPFDPMTGNYYAQHDFTTKSLHINHISLETNKTECERWEYDTTEFEKTFVTQDNLVCSKKLYRTHAILAFMAGFTGGSLGIGIISDRFGRKFALMASIVLYIGSNISLSFVNAFWVFTMLRAFSGISVGGLLNACYVMDLEMVGPTKRMLAGMVLMLFWGLGALILTGMAYLFRDWRDLNLYLALPTILFLFYIILVQESPRWLVAKRRLEKAEAILRKIARKNNRTFKGPILPDNEGEAHVARGETISCKVLCSHHQLVFKTVIIFFNWFVVAMVFLGLSWNVNYLEGDVFFNFFLTSIAEVTGFLLCIPLLNRIGRKPVYVGSLLTGGIALVLTIFPVLYGSSDIKWMMYLLSFVGKVGSSAAFATIFLYSAEFFPTVIRNSGLGIANVCARTGGMIAPYIPDLSQVVSGEVGRVLPMCTFGVLAIMAGLLSLLLPETNKRELPETFEDFRRLNGPSDQGEDIFVAPPSNGQIQQDNEMEPLNGQVQQSEESDMSQPLSGQA